MSRLSRLCIFGTRYSRAYAVFGLEDANVIGQIPRGDDTTVQKITYGEGLQTIAANFILLRPTSPFHYNVTG